MLRASRQRHLSLNLQTEMQHAPHDISLALSQSRILSIPLLLVRYRGHFNAVLSTSRDQTVPRDQMPFALLVSAWLAGDDNVLAVVFDCFSGEAICGMLSVGVVGILSI
jgi:hypothetical protein